MAQREQQITHTDGTVVSVRLLPFDVISVERQGDFKGSEQGLRLIHAAAVRQGAADVDFDAWAVTVADVTAGNGGPPDPTLPAA